MRQYGGCGYGFWVDFVRLRHVIWRGCYEAAVSVQPFPFIALCETAYILGGMVGSVPISFSSTGESCGQMLRTALVWRAWQVAAFAFATIPGPAIGFMGPFSGSAIASPKENGDFDASAVIRTLKRQGASGPR